jgi:hypothetical protein
MIYMGDIPGLEAFSPYELSMKLVNLGQQSRAMKDELFCHVMKQVTGNPNTKTYVITLG